MSAQKKKLLRRRLAGAYASSLVSISLVLMLVGIATFLIANARSVADYFKESLQISVIMEQEVTEEKAGEFKNDLDGRPFIKSTRLVTKEEGTAQMKEMLGEDFLSVFEASPIPISIDIQLKAEYVSPDSVSMVKGMLEESPLVEEVSYQQSLVEALNSNLAKISLVLGVFILLLLFISFVLIGNTVRLDVFARRFTIHTMQLVGATRSFVRGPFLKRAAIQGLAAAVLALGVLGGLIMLLNRSFEELFAIFQPRIIAMSAAIVVVTGVIVCVACTFSTVSRLLSLSKDELYG